jgi:hypothetical protein
LKPDGKELYYIAPDGKMMAATIGVREAQLEPGAPVALFQAATLLPLPFALYNRRDSCQSKSDSNSAPWKLPLYLAKAEWARFIVHAIPS